MPIRTAFALCFSIGAFLAIGTPATGQDNPLRPVKTETPADTMRTFMDAMESYRRAFENQNEAEMEFSLGRAVRTLDLSNLAPLVRPDASKEAAIYLKEVIDRVIKVDYDYIPPGKHDPNIRSPWRLKGTDIKIVKVSDHERAGEYLFSQDTVERVKQFYNLVQDLPYKDGTGHGAHYQAPWLQKHVPSWLRGNLWGVHTWQLLGGFIGILFGLIIKRTVLSFSTLFLRLAAKSKNQLDDEIVLSLRQPLSWVIASLFWFIILQFLQFEGLILSALGTLVQVIFSASLVWVFYRLSSVFSVYLDVWLHKSDIALDEQLIPLINKSIRIFVVIFGTLISLQNLGINVMSLIAGLGLGGLAFALAAKDTAANLFGSLMIFSDSPFRVGEWVKFGSVEGTVEEVGFRSTKVRTFYNSLITVPNAQIASAAIDNMGRREFRRIVASVYLTMDTPTEKIEAFLEGTKNIIKANDFTRKDYFHVILKGYNDYAFDIMLYFFLKVDDWGKELLERQNIFLEITRLAETLGVKFAFPTQDIKVQQASPQDQNQQSKAQLANIAKDFAKNGAKSEPEGRGIFTPPFLEST